MPPLEISVQLYTLRSLTEIDMPATLREVRRIGYQYVELAGFGNLKTAAELRQALDDAGLKVSGAHIALETMETDLPRVLDEQRLLANRNLIVPWLPEHRRANPTAYEQVAKSLSSIAGKVAQRGFQLAYHNHDFEFQSMQGVTGMEIIFGKTDANLVKAELDVYWVKRGGHDPARYIAHMGGRVALLHLKDMGRDAQGRFAPIGTGILDMPSIIAAGEKAGAAFGVAEQDSTYETPPLEAIRISFENLRAMGAV